MCAQRQQRVRETMSGDPPLTECFTHQGDMEPWFLEQDSWSVFGNWPFMGY